MEYEKENGVIASQRTTDKSPGTSPSLSLAMEKVPQRSEGRVRPGCWQLGTGTGKLLVLVAMLIVCTTTHAQKIWEERTGCAIAQGDLAPGYLFAQKTVTAYVDGDAALFLDNHFAAEGAVWASFATAAAGPTGVRVNDALFWGAEYHPLKPNRWDPFVAFTPGVGLVRVAYIGDEGNITRTPYTAVPLGSAAIGCNYYVGSIFHFFLKLQGVVGQASSTLPHTQRLDELKFVGGLAFNLRLWKPKDYKPKS